MDESERLLTSQKAKSNIIYISWFNGHLSRQT